MRRRATRIAIFAKHPDPGQVKTRLVAAIGAARAADLHARLAVRTIETACAAAIGPVELWCAPDVNLPAFDAWAARFGLQRHRQPDGDLGERMCHAAVLADRSNANVILLGCDCPVLRLEDVRAAAAALNEDTDVVAMPALDGGYALLGMRRALPSLFSDMPWGTSRVMQATRERIAAARLTALELRAVWDVDRPEDLVRLQAELGIHA